MSLSAQISIVQDNATPAMAALMEKTSPARLASICRAPLRAFWRDRLKKYPRLPGKFAAFPSTGFGDEAAESVEAIAGDGTILLTANKIGLRAQYEGATIRPGNAKVLCFGIVPETYGKSYAEFAAQISSQKIVDLAPPGSRKKHIVRTRTVDEARRELRGKFAFAHEIRLTGNLALVPTEDEFAEVGWEAITRSLAE
jgi:hypothetical protein